MVAALQGRCAAVTLARAFGVDLPAATAAHQTCLTRRDQRPALSKISQIVYLTII